MSRSKKYRLTPDIEAEIQRLLRPDTDRRPVPITLRFGFHKTDEDKDDSPEIPPVLQNRIRSTFEDSRRMIYEADFMPSEYRELHNAYHQVASWPIVEIRIAGYRIPYSGNLWLPLLYFYLAEPENPFTTNNNQPDASP